MSLRLAIADRAARYPRVMPLLRAAGVSALLSGVLVEAVANYAHFARVQEVEVVGNQQASVAAIRHLADVRLGSPLLLVDLDRTIAQVMQHPWVAECTVSRAYPGVVRVEVREHEDLMLLAQPQGLFRINEEGEVFVRARSSKLDLPVLTGVEPSLLSDYPAVGRRVVQDSLTVLHKVSASEFLDPEDLSEIHFNASLGFTLRLRNGSSIHLGFRAPDHQLERLRAMVESGLDLKVPHRIDLDMDGLAVATPLAS